MIRDNLNSINLPKVTTVGDGAFYDCQYLEELMTDMDIMTRNKLI